MTTRTNRVQAMAIARVSDTGADPGDSFGEDGRIFAKCNNIILPHVGLVHIDYFGPIGPNPEWNGEVTLTQFTFDLFEASEAPESLGPIDLHFDAFQNMASGKVREFRVAGKIQDPGSGTFDRTAEYPRNMVITPWRFIIGGGPNWDVLTKPASTDDSGNASGTFASTYLDLRNGHYFTQAREAGAPCIDHFKAFRVASGV